MPADLDGAVRAVPRPAGLIVVERTLNDEGDPHGRCRELHPRSHRCPGGLHTIEHVLAGLLRDHLEGVIDISPFGCRTGFHLITWGEPSVATVVAAVRVGLTAIAEDITWEDVPGVDAISCGNYRDHSLHSAREWSRHILEQGISLDAFERVGV